MTGLGLDHCYERDKATNPTISEISDLRREAWPFAEILSHFLAIWKETNLRRS